MHRCEKQDRQRKDHNWEEVNSYSRFSILMGLVTGVLNIPDIIDDSSVTWSTLLFLVALAF